MENLEQKYIHLLLNRCLNFNNSKSLFISVEKSDERSVIFVNRLMIEARKIGVNDIYVYDNNAIEKHNVLKKISLEEIDKHPVFNLAVWDEYALRGASFLILETEIPGLMDDIDPEKVARVRYIERKTRAIYKKLQLAYQIPWCIAVLPTEIWARNLFPEEENAYDKLFLMICKMCMIDTLDPIESWNNLFDKNAYIKKILNSLCISKLHYTNSLGTDLTIELPQNVMWQSAGKNNMIVNMPTYEIFTTPNFKKTEGIVYSSRPLSYNGGIVDKFFLEFKNGKVINYGAENGLEILKGIIESDEYCAYLGEVALVEDDSPISNTKMVFNNTLIDENASCHLALGTGFNSCILNNQEMSAEELLSIGVNPSKNHVDFMIGTSDLDIEAETNKGKILIFKNGNFIFRSKC